MKTLQISKEHLKELYEKDYPLWAEINLELIREKAYEVVDWENLMEEILDMGRSELKACISYLAVILEHMYKWDNFRQYTFSGSEYGGKGWIKSIENARMKIEAILNRYPSLKQKLPNELEYAWQLAIADIISSAYDMGLKIDKQDIPRKCPYTYKQAIERNLLEE